jgi:DNA-binding NarL/FixJ family response regulator
MAMGRRGTLSHDIDFAVVLFGSDEDRPPGFAKPVAQGTEAAKTPARILIVEDEYFVGALAESALAAAGYEIVGIARSAAEAVDLAVLHRPALVVMDIRLHGESDGVAAAVEILQRTGTRCLFATAHTDQGTRTRAAAANPSGWLAKPYRAADIVEAVQSILKREG